MKIKNFISNLLAAAMVVCAMGSCTDLSGIEERLDTLESDVKALQGQIAAVHTNFEALESLKGAIVINTVEAVENGYKITLSNGEVLDLQLVVEEPKEEKPEILGAIEVSENEVKITLADGTVVNVPVVENFKFAVTLNGSVVTDVQEFEVGDVMEYAVEQSNVASAAIVACPAGFKVELEETKLVVTATGAPATKATASSENEIAILAVSKQGHSVISKLKVNLADAPETPVAPAPKVKLTSSAITFNSATFAVELTNEATAYVYQCLPAAEETPALEVLTALEAKTEAEFTIEGLNANADYKVYAVAKNAEEVWGEIVTVPFKTANATNYELYNAGMDVKIGDLTINKATYGEATLVNNESENKAIGSKGVYFVDGNAEGVTIAGNAEQLVVLSLDDKTATVGRTAAKSLYINASAENDYFILSNVKYVTDMTSGNMMAGGGAEEAIETIYFHKAKIEVPADMLLIYSTKAINNLAMVDCDVRLHKGTAEKNLIQSNKEQTYETLVFKNNIFYSTDGDLTGYRLYSNNLATIASFDFNNNTIAGVYCKSAYGYVTVKSITAGNVISNLLYLPDYTTHLDGKYIGILHIADKADEHLNMPSNLAFYNYDAVPNHRAKVSYYSNNGTIYNKAKADNPIPSPDYANGVFTQGENYKSFGAKR
jgi:hypothetical protein